MSNIPRPPAPPAPQTPDDTGCVVIPLDEYRWATYRIQEALGTDIRTARGVLEIATPAFPGLKPDRPWTPDDAA